jgi:hypothetical protein
VTSEFVGVECCAGGLGCDEGNVAFWDAELLTDKAEAFELGGDIFDDAKWDRNSFSGIWVELCIIK